MDDRDIVEAERLRDDLAALGTDIRGAYGTPTSPVASAALRSRVIALAEKWLVELEPHLRTVREIRPADLADRSIAFNRLLTFADRNSRRSLYEKEIGRIVRDFRGEVIVPAKAALGSGAQPLHEDARFVPTAFVGHSFLDADKEVVAFVVETLGAIGIHTESGLRPSADTISAKVKRRIEAMHMFVGIFTRREKIARRAAWTTSAWVLDEKTYAHARGRRLILLREAGVDSIGGIQADWEWMEFDRAKLDKVALWLISLFDVKVSDFRA